MPSDCWRLVGCRDFELFAACQITEDCYVFGNADRGNLSAIVGASEQIAKRFDLDNDGVAHDFDPEAILPG